MRKTTIVLVGVIAMAAMTTTPVTAEETNVGDVEPSPCVDISLDPIGVAVDPRCLEDKLPSADDRIGH